MSYISVKRYKSDTIKNVIKHYDKTERKLNYQTKNNRIDISKTDNNIQYDLSYQDTCKKFDKQIFCLDCTPGSNRDENRITCLNIIVPFPKKLPKKYESEWIYKVNDIFNQTFKEENVLQCYVLYDERRKRIVDGVEKYIPVRPYACFIVIPEYNNKLNASKVCTSMTFNKIDSMIQKMTMSNYKIDFIPKPKRPVIKHTPSKSIAECEKIYKTQVSNLDNKYDSLHDNLQKDYNERLRRLDEEYNALQSNNKK